MDSIWSNKNLYLERIKKRSEENKGVEYRSLWVKVSFAVVRDKHIKRTGARGFVIFLVLRTYMNKDGVAYPSLSRISDESGCSRRSVQNELVKLEKCGWIRKLGRLRDKGKFVNMKYLILEKNFVRGTGEKSFMSKPVA